MDKKIIAIAIAVVLIASAFSIYGAFRSSVSLPTVATLTVVSNQGNFTMTITDTNNNGRVYSTESNAGNWTIILPNGSYSYTAISWNLYFASGVFSIKGVNKTIKLFPTGPILGE